jgi:hypothetical protein
MLGGGYYLHSEAAFLFSYLFICAITRLAVRRVGQRREKINWMMFV